MAGGGPVGDLTRPDDGSPRGGGGGLAPAQCGETDKKKWGPESKFRVTRQFRRVASRAPSDDVGEGNVVRRSCPSKI